jgi:hypothetical protein
MPLLRIVDYILDYKPGSTGIVFFKTEDGVPRKTPELQPAVFNSLAFVVVNPCVFDSGNFSFRTLPHTRLAFANKKKGFTEEELKNTETFETWQLQLKN